MKIIYLISIIYVTTIIGQSNVEFSIVTNHVDQTINNNEPCLALNPTDESNLVVATNYRDINQYTPTSYDSAKIGIYYTVNGGDSWSDLRLPQMGRSICADPGIFFNNNGDLYCSYLGSYSENVIGAIDDSISGIYLNISTNKGQGWLVNSLIVEEKKLPFGVDKPLISVDNGTQSPFNGRVYVAYVETEGTLVKKIKLSFYDPGAQEISTPIVVNDTSIVKYVMAPFITVDKYGFVYIYFLANTTGNHQQDYKLKMLKLNPGGESVVQNSEKVISDIQPWTGDNYFAPFRTPSFPFAVYNKSTNESVVVINDYYTGTEGYLETVYFRSTNGGESWGVANRISTPIGHQFFSTISTNSQGLYSISYIKRDVDLEQYISAIHLSSDNLLSFNDEIELLDYNFYDTNLAWLNFAGDYLWSQMSDNYVYNVWINADNSTSSPQRILLSKTPILLDITPQNDLDGESKGKMLVNNEAVNSGFVKKLEPYLDHAFEVYDEILISQQQEVYKYRNWEDETLSSTFTKSFDYNTNNLSVTLFYKSTRPLTVHNYLEGGSGGFINIAWLPNGSQVKDDDISSGEFYNAFDATDLPDRYNVSINQTIPDQYGTNWEFQYWDDGSTSLTRSNIAVSEPTTLKAYYKGVDKTDAANALTNNNQAKIIRTGNSSSGTLFKVYESMDCVWLEKSTNNGVSWELMNDGKPHQHFL